MEKIISAIEKLENLRQLQPATPEQIENAEKQLGLNFAQEYKEYVEKYGAISAKGIELTGITPFSRLNVVEVTKSERGLNNIPSNLYVIENVAIEGIVLLQNTLGEIYELNESSKLQKRYNSLCEYIENEHIN